MKRHSKLLLPDITSKKKKRENKEKRNNEWRQKQKKNISKLANIKTKQEIWFHVFVVCLVFMPGFDYIVASTLKYFYWQTYDTPKEKQKKKNHKNVYTFVVFQSNQNRWEEHKNVTFLRIFAALAYFCHNRFDRTHIRIHINMDNCI